MKLLWAFLVVLITISGIAQAAYMNDTAFNQGNGIYLTFNQTTFDNLTCCSSNTFFMNVSGNATTWTVGANHTITTPTHIADNFSFETDGSGYLNFSSTMVQTLGFYSLASDGITVDVRNTDSNKKTWFNYTGEAFLSVTDNIFIAVYNTGWQSLLVPVTQTMQTFGNRYSTTWLSSWNATFQAYESYKVGWLPRASQSLAKGAGVLAKFSTNKTIGMTMNASYSWNLSAEYNLVGLERDATLSQINASVNTVCEVDTISYINLSTQTEYIFTCGNAGNGSVLVNAGEALWMNATTAINKARSW